MTATTPADRETLDKRLAGLRRARGEALAAGRRFDHSKILDVMSELDGLDDVEAAQARAAYTTAEEAAKQRHAQSVANITDAFGTYLATAEDFEAKLDALAVTIKSLQDLAATIVTSANAITPGSLGVSLDPYELDERLTRCAVNRVFKKLSRAHGRAFGSLSWLAESSPADPADFLKHEAASVGKDVEIIVHPAPVALPVTPAIKELQNVE